MSQEAIYTDQIEPDQLFTVYKSLQDEYVAKNLDLELGSLTNYIDLNCLDSTPKLPNLRLERRFHKKTDSQPKKFDLPREEKDLQNPKTIVQNIFKEVFGQDIIDFEMANTLPKLEKDFRFQDVDTIQKKYLKIPIDKRIEMFQNEFGNLQAKQELKLKISDGTVQRTAQIKNSGSGSRKDQNDDSLPNSVPKYNIKQFFQPNIDVLDENLILQTRLDNLIKLKTKYMDINEVWMEYFQNIQSNNFQEYRLANKKQQQLQQEFQIFGYQEPRCLELMKQVQFKHKHAENEPIVITKQMNQVIFRCKPLSLNHLIFFSINQQPLINVQKIEFYKTELSESSMKLVLTLIGEAIKLNYLNLSFNQLSNTTSILLAQQLKQLKYLKTLKLSGMGITTKMFLELCISMVESKIQQLDLSNNEIDSNGYEAIETLLKYMKSLEIADFENNSIIDNINPLLSKKNRSLEHLHKLKHHYQGKVERQLKI